MQCGLSAADLLALERNLAKMQVLNEAPRWMNNENIWCQAVPLANVKERKK